MKSDKDIRLLLQSARDELAAGHHTEEGDESIIGIAIALMWVLDKKVDPSHQKSIDTLTDIARTERRKQAANAWRNASRFN